MLKKNRSTGSRGRGAARLIAALVVLAGASGCLELDIPNLNDADAARAAGNAEDVQAFIGGAFYPTMWNALHDDQQTTAAWPVAASESTATMSGLTTQLFWEELREPRGLHDNGVILSIGNGPQGARDYWAWVNETASVAYDGLRFLDGGIEIEEDDVDVTPRARAFAKFMQGWAWGYGAMMFDQFHALPEDVELPADPLLVVDVAVEHLFDYDVVVELAIDALEEAISIAQANPTVVQYPAFPESQFWFGSPTPISNDKFIRMANTLAARLLVLSSRNPQDRADVPWDRVLAYTANGLNDAVGDYEFQLQGVRESQLMSRFINSATGTQNYRWDYRAIGPADQSGAYQNWIGSPVAQRDRFNIETPDRRITGLTPTSNGSYTVYHANDNGFTAERGTYLFSAYQWRRHHLENGISNLNDDADDIGEYGLITVDENTLLRAEAFLRTNNAAAAVPLINVTRTRPRTILGTEHPGLPAVTVAGVPNPGGVCVPRLDNGDCGGLFAALRYEIVIENAVMDVARGYAESRGWGTLPDGALLHWPVPGNALSLYGLSLYTYGGVGNPSTATYGPTPN
ncbi:MAG: hypothetical protein WEG36_13965 [Gemmatimonadota bacterium]